ncbi:MAG: TVP38/TMEM64 family protein [Burkholderiales bacterium]|nr:TVP38/TMEM64 family protein [Burkholderiales bacterium]
MTADTARPKKRPRKPAWGKLVAAAVVIAALTAAWRYTPLADYLTAQRIGAWARYVREMQLAPLWTVIAYVVTSYLMFPRPLLTLFTVIAFGPWLGFTYSMLGIMVAALSHYYVGRLLPPDFIRKLMGDKMDRIGDRLRDHGFLTVFAIRVVPVAPFPVEGFAAGAKRLRVWDYSLGTFLGMLPGVLATTIFGREIERALNDPSQINYWVLGGVVLALILVTVLVGRWLNKLQAAPA